MKFKQHLEEQRRIMKFRSILDVVDALGKIPAAKKYVVKGSEYENINFEIIYKIPKMDLKKMLGLTVDDLKKMSSKGGISKGDYTIKGNFVMLYVEAHGS